MPRLIVSPGASQGIERCRQFLLGKNPLAAKRAAEAIGRGLAALEAHPEIGRPYALMPELRELLIGFGDSGYVALYRHLPEQDSVVVLAFRHQKEAGY